MKLVRNRVPEKFPQNTYHIADQREFVAMLKLKLVEEAAEIAGTRNETELVEELADLIEVADTLVKRLHLGPQVVAARLDKKRRLGGFSEGWVMTEYTEGDK